MRTLFLTFLMIGCLGLLGVVFFKSGTSSELVFMTSDQCQIDSPEFQKCERADKSLYMRQVKSPENRLVTVEYLSLPDSGEMGYEFTFHWFEECFPETRIEAGLSPSGEKIGIDCSEGQTKYVSATAPTRLSYSFFTDRLVDLKFSRKGFDFGVSVTGEDFSEMVRRYEVLNADLLKDIEEKERKEEEERIAREKEREIQEAELASRRKKEAAQKLEAEKRRAEQEKVAAKEKKERERVARIEKANSIKACEDGNRKRLGELRASVENQKSRLLNNSEALTFFCDSYYNSYQTVVCKRWGISLDNRSMYPIKAIKVGFDEYRVCADDPAKTFTLDMDVSAFGKSEVKYVEWYGDIQKWEYTFWGGKWVETPVCTKLLAVDYKVGFQPVSCK